MTVCSCNYVYIYSCSETIPQCELQFNPRGDCCDNPKGFDPTPLFTSKGTCFTWNPLFGESDAQSSNYARLILAMFPADMPQYEVKFKDGYAADMNGFAFAVSNADHPSVAIESNPQLANIGKTRMIKLALSRVRANRRLRHFKHFKLFLDQSKGAGLA